MICVHEYILVRNVSNVYNSYSSGRRGVDYEGESLILSLSLERCLSKNRSKILYQCNNVKTHYLF